MRRSWSGYLGLEGSHQLSQWRDEEQGPHNPWLGSDLWPTGRPWTRSFISEPSTPHLQNGGITWGQIKCHNPFNNLTIVPAHSESPITVDVVIYFSPSVYRTASGQNWCAMVLMNSTRKQVHQPHGRWEAHGINFWLIKPKTAVSQ